MDALLLYDKKYIFLLDNSTRRYYYEHMNNCSYEKQ